MLQKCINTKSKTILRYSFYDLNIHMHQKILIDLRKRHIKLFISINCNIPDVVGFKNVPGIVLRYPNVSLIIGYWPAVPQGWQIHKNTFFFHAGISFYDRAKELYIHLSARSVCINGGSFS